MKISKGIIYLLLSTLIYSSISVFIRIMNAGHLPPMTQVFGRYVFAFLAALIYFKITKSRFSVKKVDIFLLVLIAILGYALTNLAFTYAIIFTQISTTLFIFYSCFMITPVLGVIFLHEKVNKPMVLSLIVSLIGLLFLFKPNPISTWQLGALFAFLSALAQAFYLIGRKKLAHYDSKLILLVSTFLGAISVGIASAIFEGNFYSTTIAAVTPATWLVVSIAGVANFSAWLLMSKGFQIIKTSTASLVMLVENIFAIFYGLFLFQEIPTVYTLLGGFLILFATVIIILKGDQV